MRREGQACYVGLLKAAELHGATNQAVMEFQVISNKRLPRIRACRNLIVFYFRKEMEAVTAGIDGRTTDSGTMKVSSATLTALDPLRYPPAFGGIDNVATVLSDLSLGVVKSRLAAGVESRSGTLVDLCRSLVQIDSTNPPGDIGAVVEAIEAVLDATATPSIDPFFSRLLVFTNRCRAQCRIRYWERRIRGVVHAPHARSV